MGIAHSSMRHITPASCWTTTTQSHAVNPVSGFWIARKQRTRLLPTSFSSPALLRSLPLTRNTDCKPMLSAHATTSNQALCIHAPMLSCKPDRIPWVLRFRRRRRLIRVCCLLRPLCHLRRLQVSFLKRYQAGNANFGAWFIIYRGDYAKGSATWSRRVA